MRAATAAVAILLTACALNFGYFVYWNNHDVDEMYYAKSALVSPSQCKYTPGEPWSPGYAYAVDHPSLQRYVYGWMLGMMGVTDLYAPDVDYSRPASWNLDQGHVPPMTQVVIPLRAVNAFFMTGATMLIFFAALLILERPYRALLVALPLVLSERICVGVVAYLGTDAILAFWLALSLFVTVILDRHGKALTFFGAVALGAIAGLAVSTKFNGALALGAYCVFAAVAARGWRRFTLPAVSCAVCAAVFVAINPVMHAGLFDGLRAARDMLAVRRQIWAEQSSRWGGSRIEIVGRFLPYGAFAFALAGAILKLVKKRWLLPVGTWCLVLALGTALTVSYSPKRYHMPVEMALFFLAGVCAWEVYAANGEKKSEPGHGLRMGKWFTIKACAAAVLIALVLTAYVTLERWGPTRLNVRVPVVSRATLFLRQAAAYYGFSDRLSRREVSAYVQPPTLDVHAKPGGTTPELLPDPILDTQMQRTLATGLMLLASWVVYMAAVRISSSRLAAAVAAAVFLYCQVTLGSGFDSVGESLSGVSSALCVLFLVTWRDAKGWTSSLLLIALGVSCAAAMAASPTGILSVAAAALCVASREGIGRSTVNILAVVVLALVFFPVLEQMFWLAGGRSAYEFVYSVSNGAASFRIGPYFAPSALMTPVRAVFPFLPFVALAAVICLKAERMRSMAEVATWAGFVLFGVMFTLPDSSLLKALDQPPGLPVAANVAFALSAALPGLLYLIDAGKALRRGIFAG